MGHDENEKKAVSEKLDSLNWGSDAAWLALMDECFEKEVGEFTYKVCIGGEAKQGNTKLGKFEKWDGETMVYEKGAKCWNGPKRSIQVKVRCGPETKLLSVRNLQCACTSLNLKHQLLVCCHLLRMNHLI